MKTNEATSPVGRPLGSLQPGSMTERVADLEIGACESRTVRFAVAGSRSADIAAEASRLSNILRPAITRASKLTGNTYAVNTGSFLTADHTWYVVSAVVTRLS